MILTLLACEQPDLTQEWDLDRLRLLAIRADPAEPAPGDVVTFSSLRYVPDGAEWASVWIACIAGGDCTLDPTLFDRFAEFETLTPEEQAELIAALQAAGFIGFEPGLTPTWPVAADALAGLTTAELLEGTSASIQVTLTTEADTELVLKNVPVSLATTPNSNPDVATFTYDGADAGAGFTVGTGEQIALEATVAALEEYDYVTTDGVAETRTESLEWRWYVSGGEPALDFGGELDPEPEDTLVSDITWITPDEPGTYTVAAVVLDGRGGMGWWELSVVVE